MSMTWSHIVLYVHDTERMLDFYQRVLGFQITDRGDIPGQGYEIIFLSQDAGEHHQIGFATSRDRVEASNSVAHVAFRLDGLGALRRTIAALEGEGIRLRYTTHGNTWSIYFQDPEQNGIELFCDTPWQVQQPIVETWDKAMADDELLAWTEARFRDHPRFESQAAFRARRAAELATD